MNSVINLYGNKKNERKIIAKNSSKDLNSSSFCSKVLSISKRSDELTIESIHTISKSVESIKVKIDDEKLRY